LQLAIFASEQLKIGRKGRSENQGALELRTSRNSVVVSLSTSKATLQWIAVEGRKFEIGPTPVVHETALTYGDGLDFLGRLTPPFSSTTAASNVVVVSSPENTQHCTE
jgi:hypothetical protein